MIHVAQNLFYNFYNRKTIKDNVDILNPISYMLRGESKWFLIISSDCH